MHAPGGLLSALPLPPMQRAVEGAMTVREAFSVGGVHVSFFGEKFDGNLETGQDCSAAYLVFRARNVTGTHCGSGVTKRAV